MSQTADPNKEYESANGGPEKSFEDTEVINKDEGEESDDYEEIDDEVCVQGTITDLGVQFILTGGKTDRRRRRRWGWRRRGMYLRPIFMYIDIHHLQEQQNTLTHLLIGNVSYIYLFTLFRCIDLVKPNGATVENEEYEEDDDEGDDDDDNDDDDDDEYIEEDEEVDAAHPNPLNKKRSIDEVVDKEASQGSKKIKAWQAWIEISGRSTCCLLLAWN